MYLTSILTITTLILLMAPMTESIISMGAILMATAIMSTITVTSAMGSWFGFILFLMYITGILVLFSYMLAMTPNNQNTKPAVAKNTLLVTLVTIVTMQATGKMKVEAKPMKGKSNMEEEITQLYNNTSMSMYWMMAVILLVALLMAVKMCYKSPKPLRQFLK